MFMSQVRDLHWTKTYWPLQEALVPGGKNVDNTILVSPKKVLLPGLHKKMGPMKQSVKSLPKNGECFRYPCSKFQELSKVKLKEAILTDPDIRKLLSDPLFSETVNEKEEEASNSFKDVVQNFFRE